MDTGTLVEITDNMVNYNKDTTHIGKTVNTVIDSVTNDAKMVNIINTDTSPIINMIDDQNQFVFDNDMSDEEQSNDIMVETASDTVGIKLIRAGKPFDIDMVNKFSTNINNHKNCDCILKDDMDLLAATCIVNMKKRLEHVDEIPIMNIIPTENSRYNNDVLVSILSLYMYSDIMLTFL
jgi:hypothetical protein